VKRTSGQAALDDSFRSSSSSPRPACFTITRPINVPSNGRLVRPIPKRFKPSAKLLQAVHSPSTEQTVQRSPAPFAGSSSFLSTPSSFSSSSSASPSTRVQPVRRSSRNIGKEPMRYPSRYSSSDDEADNHDERRDAEEIPPIRFNARLRSQMLVAAPNSIGQSY
jgi:hypothetical protein